MDSDDVGGCCGLILWALILIGFVATVNYVIGR